MLPDLDWNQADYAATFRQAVKLAQQNRAMTKQANPKPAAPPPPTAPKSTTPTPPAPTKLGVPPTEPWDRHLAWGLMGTGIGAGMGALRNIGRKRTSYLRDMLLGGAMGGMAGGGISYGLNAMGDATKEPASPKGMKLVSQLTEAVDSAEKGGRLPDAAVAKVRGLIDQLSPQPGENAGTYNTRAQGVLAEISKEMRGKTKLPWLSMGTNELYDMYQDWDGYRLGTAGLGLGLGATHKLLNMRHLGNQQTLAGLRSTTKIDGPLRDYHRYMINPKSNPSTGALDFYKSLRHSSGTNTPTVGFWGGINHEGTLPNKTVMEAARLRGQGIVKKPISLLRGNAASLALTAAPLLMDIIYRGLSRNTPVGPRSHEAYGVEQGSKAVQDYYREILSQGNKKP